MSEKLKVFIRIRPARRDHYTLHSNDSFSDDSIEDIYEYHYQKNEFVMNKKVYTIDGILPPDTTQSDTYQRIASHQTDQFLKGFNATIFAYGQTGSGKTHTIFGPDLTQESGHTLTTMAKSFSDENNPNPKVSLFGIVPRAFINVHERLSHSKNITKYQMTLSCVEVYNTKLRDLIQPGNSDKLKIREDRISKGFFVQQLTEENVDSAEELILFIKRIQLNRSVSATNMNATSSRSHVLLRLKIIQQLLDGETKESVLTFVDLAGSEMCKKTGSNGNTLKEAGYINGSLSTLSRVIEALGKSQKNKKHKNCHSHIPFRDSSLTKLLKSALGGNCKTALVVCVSQESHYKDETLSTLRFASRAACIECKAVVNIVLDAKKLYRENLRLKALIEKLKAGVNTNDNQKLLQQKLKELEQREIEIAELQKYLEELELKLEQQNNDNEEDTNLEDRLKEIEQQNIESNQTISDLEIQLMREKKSKEIAEEKLNEMQLMASDAASQIVVEQASDMLFTEMSNRASPMKNAIKLRRLSCAAIKDAVCKKKANTQFKAILMNHMPELKLNHIDPDIFDPMCILNVCKYLTDQLKEKEQCIDEETQINTDELTKNKQIKHMSTQTNKLQNNEINDAQESTDMVESNTKIKFEEEKQNQSNIELETALMNDLDSENGYATNASDDSKSMNATVKRVELTFQSPNKKFEGLLKIEQKEKDKQINALQSKIDALQLVNKEIVESNNLLNEKLGNALSQNDELVKDNQATLVQKETEVEQAMIQIKEQEKLITDLHFKLSALDQEKTNQASEMIRIKEKMQMLQRETTAIIRDTEEIIRQEKESLNNKSVEIIRDDNKTKIESSTKTEHLRQTMDENITESIAVIKTHWSIFKIFKCNSGVNH